MSRARCTVLEKDIEGLGDVYKKPPIPEEERSKTMVRSISDSASNLFPIILYDLDSVQAKPNRVELTAPRTPVNATLAGCNTIVAGKT